MQFASGQLFYSVWCGCQWLSVVEGMYSKKRWERAREKNDLIYYFSRLFLLTFCLPLCLHNFCFVIHFQLSSQMIFSIWFFSEIILIFWNFHSHFIITLDNWQSKENATIQIRKSLDIELAKGLIWKITGEIFFYQFVLLKFETFRIHWTFLGDADK